MLLGLLSTIVISLVALLMAQWHWIATLHLSSLVLAIVLGMVVGNLGLARQTALQPGLRFAQQHLLRWGVALYAFHITWSELRGLGLPIIGLDLLVVSAVLGTGYLVGRHVLGLDRDTALLTSAGSAICGAAAVVATDGVLRSEQSRVAVAVATVVVFGTLSMFLYPVMFPLLHLDEAQYGVYIGSTIHEVAQVVAAGAAIGPAATDQGVVTKLLRVLLLVPFLLLLSVRVSRSTPGGRITIPWFAVAFMIGVAVNSLWLQGTPVAAGLRSGSTVMLTLAMAALGVNTHLPALRAAGWRPFALAGLLYLLLTVGGYWANRWLITAL